MSLERFGNAALYGRNPVSPEAQADYFDSLFHSHAVVGLVTSAFLEAAIVGRPVYTPLLPEFEMYQEGVQHFRYLMEVEGGLLKVYSLVRGSSGRAGAALARPVGRDEQNARFIRAFVRPSGLEVPATPAFVAAVEQIGAGAAAAEAPAWHRAMQPLVRAVVRSSEEGWLRAALRDTPEMINDRAKARKAAHKQAAAVEREQRVADKRDFLASRRRERQREQWVGARGSSSRESRDDSRRWWGRPREREPGAHARWHRHDAAQPGGSTSPRRSTRCWISRSQLQAHARGRRLDRRSGGDSPAGRAPTRG